MKEKCAHKLFFRVPGDDSWKCCHCDMVISSRAMVMLNEIRELSRRADELIKKFGGPHERSKV